MKERIEAASRIFPSVFFLILLALLAVPGAGHCIELRTGGFVKFKSSFFFPGDDSLQGLVRSDAGSGGSFESRLNAQAFISPELSFEAHYRLYIFAGEDRRRTRKLLERYPFLGSTWLFSTGDSIRRDRFFDLSKEIHSGDSALAFHEIDRLNLTFSRPSWSITVGRQAVSWGHGFLFNPFDVINPFSPTEIDREYKPGEDMINLQMAPPGGGSFRIIFAPARNPSSGDFSLDRSSAGFLAECSIGGVDMNWLLLTRLDDLVLGAGFVSYAGDAAIRGDLTWTVLDDASGREDFFSLVLNTDYSWVYAGKNFYGFLEYYYNGIGGDDYPRVASRPEVSERLLRGEIFTLGKNYLSGSLRVELHPLYSQFFTFITNLDDPSAVAEIYGVWDAATDFQVTLGATFYLGGKGTEFGGIEIPGTGYYQSNPDTVFLWLSRYF